MQVYLVHTTIVLANGTQVSLPAALFTDPEAAERACAERQRVLESRIPAKLVESAGGDEVTDLGMTFGQALGALGIMAFATAVAELPVEDSRISLASKLPTGIVMGGRA